jgi:hypothetical protein
VDAFLLKIVIEERLGYPVQLISDGLLPGLESALNLSGVASVYAALASGEVHIYPEARLHSTLAHIVHKIGGWCYSGGQQRYCQACSRFCFGDKRGVHKDTQCMAVCRYVCSSSTDDLVLCAPGISARWRMLTMIIL